MLIPCATGFRNTDQTFLLLPSQVNEIERYVSWQHFNTLQTNVTLKCKQFIKHSWSMLETSTQANDGNLFRAIIPHTHTHTKPSCVLSRGYFQLSSHELFVRRFAIVFQLFSTRCTGNKPAFPLPLQRILIGRINICGNGFQIMLIVRLVAANPVDCKFYHAPFSWWGRQNVDLLIFPTSMGGRCWPINTTDGNL